MRSSSLPEPSALRDSEAAERLLGRGGAEVHVAPVLVLGLECCGCGEYREERLGELVGRAKLVGVVGMHDRAVVEDRVAAEDTAAAEDGSDLLEHRVDVVQREVLDRAVPDDEVVVPVREVVDDDVAAAVRDPRMSMPVPGMLERRLIPVARIHVGGRLRIEMKRVEAVAAAEVENASLAWQELARIHAALEEVRTPFFRETEQIGTVVEPFGGVVQPPAAVGVPAVERAEIALSDAHGRLVVEVVADGLAGRLALRTEPRS